MSSVEEEIDDSLYSRQRYVLGDSAMQRMAKSNVLLINIGGLGVEIAKNIVLAGIKSLTIQDGCAVTVQDLGCQFFIRDEDIRNKANRASACAPRVAELNPYVSVKRLTKPLEDNTDLSYLQNFQCVILTETPLDMQIKVDNFCRSQDPPIKFITADVYGVFCWGFCDFGKDFEVVDPTGEEPKEFLISHVTKEKPGLVTTLQDSMHGLESGDIVTFREVNGMNAINGQQHKVKVVSPYQFSICDTSGPQYEPYKHGGTVTQIKQPKAMTFTSLHEQCASPDLLTADLSKLDAPRNIHVGMLALHKFKSLHGRLPKTWCAQDADQFVQIAREENGKLSNEGAIDETTLRQLSYTSQGCMAPLCAALGGVIAQEALKALTGKFTPLKQWIHLDTVELLAGLEPKDSTDFQPSQTRYDSLRACIGSDLCKRLSELNLFMVGCGAIGCEMIKNYALLGIGTSGKGKVTVTDNDLIEKSNLNRQFLFRPRHIRKPKSTTAVESAQEINPAFTADARQHKVCPQTESEVFHDQFFEAQDIIVNALDNVEARRYMDSRCVTNQRPLLESGTMGAKGHVQVIVPHLTESYGSQRDPEEVEVPYCTLKSFPSQIEHCIQWARDKFESSFTQKPQLHNKFWSNSNVQDIVQRLTDSRSVDGSVVASKVVANRPLTWLQCVSIARQKFEKYFNHRAKNLLHMFPLDTKMTDGSLFWQSPKRPPTPVEFDVKNPTHMCFIAACARLLADVCGVSYNAPDVQSTNVEAMLSSISVRPFRPSSKKIETDLNAKKNEETEVSGDDLKDAANRIQRARLSSEEVFTNMNPASFEKDDDGNGHIDFITSASNLRALMYNLETADRLKTKRIAGRIVPAIATTTAAVAGLVTIELLKVLKSAPLDSYRNCFLNLALPVFLFSEPGPVEKLTMKNGVGYTLWERWEIRGNRDFTIQQLIAAIKEKYGVTAESVIHGVKMVYVPIIPGHKKRLTQPLLKFLKPAPRKSYTDLVVGFKSSSRPDAEEEDGGPSIRYYFGL